jgi:adenylylsulfate kinase
VSEAIGLESCCVWLTGRAGAGKSTVGRGVVEELRARHQRVVLLDDAEVTAYLAGPGESTRSALAWLCRMLVTNGITVVVAAAMPGRADRDRLRDEVPGLAEVYLDAPPELAEARAGHPDEAYEEPFAPDLRVPAHDRQPAASAAQVVGFLEHHGFAPPSPAS